MKVKLIILFIILLSIVACSNLEVSIEGCSDKAQMIIEELGWESIKECSDEEYIVDGVELHYVLVKSGEGMLLTLLSEIEVEALPADLPSSFEIDASHLKEIGEGITIAELKFDKEKVEIVDKEPEEFVVRIDYAEMEEEPEEEAELTEEELIEGIEATEEKEESEEEDTQEEKKEQPEESPEEK